MSHLFTSGGQNIGVSALASVLPVNIQGWSPLRLTGLISLLSKGLWRVFSSTTVRRHQFFGVLPSLWSSSHNRTWPLGTNWVKQCVFLWRLLSSVWGTAGAVKEYIVCTHCVGMCLLTLAVPVPRARRTVANIKDYTFWNYLASLIRNENIVSRSSPVNFFLLLFEPGLGHMVTRKTQNRMIIWQGGWDETDWA